MRISSLHIFETARKSMANANEDIVKTQEQMSTGKRVLTPADDPVASTKILQLTDELSSVDQYLKNIDIAENNLSLEESVLNNINGIVQRMQEMAVKAGNTASLTPNEYQAMASEVATRLDEMLNLMNTKSAGGDYLFGGYKSQQPPFSGNSFAGYHYQGDEGRQHINVSANATVATTDSGKDLFMDVDSSQKTVTTSVSSANRSSPPVQISVGQVVDRQVYDEFYPQDMMITFNDPSDVAPPAQNYTVTERSSGRVLAANQSYIAGDPIQLNGVEVKVTGSPVPGDRLFIDSTEKQDLLTTVSRFKNIMEAYDGSSESRETLESVVAETLDNLGNAQNSILDVQASIGARINTLDSTRDLHLDTQVLSKKVMSQLRDVDYAEASTRLSQQSLILQAAQQSFIRVSQLNLFSRL